MKRLTTMLLFLLALNAAVAEIPKKSCIQFKPHVYVGMGILSILSEDPPYYATIDRETGALETSNFRFGSQGLNFQGQARLSLIQIGPVSLGYTFWGYRHRYEDEYQEIWYREFVLYPLTYDLSLHAGCIQIDLPFLNMAGGKIRPFVVGGAGPFFGNTKEVFYIFDPVYEGLIWKYVFRDRKFDGMAWTAGTGVIVHRYFYAYMGITQFNEDNLPGSLFLNVIVGLTL
ncbi:hypothetical protein JW948_17170 [bacterium]|nr:hypothetical protein [bacterium]